MAHRGIWAFFRTCMYGLNTSKDFTVLLFSAISKVHRFGLVSDLLDKLNTLMITSKYFHPQLTFELFK